MIPLPRFLKRFYRDTQGSLSLETILYLPPLICMFMISLILFDGFRALNLSQKAAYSISDAISRETSALDDSYLDGMENLYTDIVGRKAGYGIRFSEIRWSDNQNAYIVDWSQTRGTLLTSPLDDADVNNNPDSFPLLQNGERVVLVETRSNVAIPEAFRSSNTSEYQPMMAILFDLDEFTLSSNVITRPRFSPQVCWQSC